MAQLSQTSQILKILRKAGNKGVPNYKFPQHRIIRYSGRIAELRQSGHNIYCERQIVRGRLTGVWIYFLNEDEK